jgi:hypothetical protein
MLHSRPCTLSCWINYSLLQLRNSAHLYRRSTDTCHRKHMSRDGYPASTLVRWLLPTENMPCDSYLQLWWRYCTCAEMYLPSRCLEADCITPLFYCCVLDRVCCGGCLTMELYVTLLRKFWRWIPVLLPNSISHFSYVLLLTSYLSLISHMTYSFEHFQNCIVSISYLFQVCYMSPKTQLPM